MIFIFNTLKTPFEENSDYSWEEYPRPQFKRDSFFSLNGEWDLFLKDKRATEFIGKITVPYPPESRISGIKRQLEKNEKYIYRRNFSLPESFNKGRVLLHFGAVDQISRVFLNGEFICENIGGYLPFSADITDCLKEENELMLEVEDNLDTDIPYGKQRKKRGGMWYTKISGIWQTVWLESVNEKYIESIKITPSLNEVKIEVLGGEEKKEIFYTDGEKQKSISFFGDSITVKPENPILWSPENPHLYYFTLLSGKDKIESYFALRTVSVGDRNGTPVILLNGKPYFFHGLLDQGYFADGIYTPYSPDGYIFDILNMKNLGFNTLRKHIKLEPELFYYYCDKHGMIVFQDMVNSGKYSFLIDTALPTVALKRGVTHKASKRRREIFEDACKKTLAQLYNHPCVCYYTIFNEGWGQYDADRIYSLLKASDPTRIFDSTSGWFFKTKSDVESHHIYFKKLRFKKGYTRPLILSEFGGYSCNLAEHSFNLDSSFGYSKNLTPKQFEERLKNLYENEVIPAINEYSLCGCILTQLSDVEDETNGLVTYDRQLIKVEKSPLTAIADKLFTAFNKRV